MSCKVAFIGAGNMGREHIRAFADIPGVQLTGTYTRTPLRAEELIKEFSFTNGVLSTIEELYTVTKADLVVIAVPELSVRAVCSEVFKYPWTCLVEKPVGYTLEDAISIYETALANNTKVLVALNRRHYSVTKQLLAEIHDNEQPRLIHVFDQEDPAQALAGGQPELVVKTGCMLIRSI